jgi:serine/threonine-protein kinase RsbW
MSAAAEGAATSAVSLTIPAKAEYLVFCRLAVAGLARAARIDPETVSDLKLAVTEACSNAIRHAYAEEGGGHVFVRFELADESVVVQVADDGHGFQISPIDFLEPREVGMGLAIIQALTDELDISVGNGGHGTLVRFRKTFS